MNKAAKVSRAIEDSTNIPQDRQANYLGVASGLMAVANAWVDPGFSGMLFGTVFGLYGVDSYSRLKNPVPRTVFQQINRNSRDLIRTYLGASFGGLLVATNMILNVPINADSFTVGMTYLLMAPSGAINRSLRYDHPPLELIKNE